MHHSIIVCFFVFSVLNDFGALPELSALVVEIADITGLPGAAISGFILPSAVGPLLENADIIDFGTFEDRVNNMSKKLESMAGITNMSQLNHPNSISFRIWT